MEQNGQDRLKEKETVLVEELVLWPILANLRSLHVINEEMADKMKRGLKPRSHRDADVIQEIAGLDNSIFEAFFQALVNTCQERFADVIRPLVNATVLESMDRSAQNSPIPMIPSGTVDSRKERGGDAEGVVVGQGTRESAEEEQVDEVGDSEGGDLEVGDSKGGEDFDFVALWAEFGDEMPDDGEGEEAQDLDFLLMGEWAEDGEEVPGKGEEEQVAEEIEPPLELNHCSEQNEVPERDTDSGDVRDVEEEQKNEEDQVLEKKVDEQKALNPNTFDGIDMAYITGPCKPLVELNVVQERKELGGQKEDGGRDVVARSPGTRPNTEEEHGEDVAGNLEKERGDLVQDATRKELGENAETAEGDEAQAADGIEPPLVLKHCSEKNAAPEREADSDVVGDLDKEQKTENKNPVLEKNVVKKKALKPNVFNGIDLTDIFVPRKPLVEVNMVLERKELGGQKEGRDVVAGPPGTRPTAEEEHGEDVAGSVFKENEDLGRGAAHKMLGERVEVGKEAFKDVEGDVKKDVVAGPPGTRPIAEQQQGEDVAGNVVKKNGDLGRDISRKTLGEKAEAGKGAPKYGKGNQAKVPVKKPSLQKAQKVVWKKIGTRLAVRQFPARNNPKRKREISDPTVISNEFVKKQPGKRLEVGNEEAPEEEHEDVAKEVVKNEPEKRAEVGNEKEASEEDNEDVAKVPSQKPQKIPQTRKTGGRRAEGTSKKDQVPVTATRQSARIKASVSVKPALIRRNHEVVTGTLPSRAKSCKTVLKKRKTAGADDVLDLGDIAVRIDRDVKELGEGGFAFVYPGTDVDTGEELAVKVAANSTAAKKEFDVLSDIRRRGGQKNLVHFLGGKLLPDGRIYLAMERLGISLLEFLNDAGRLPLNETALLFLQMLGGIDFLHDMGICHGDVKPDNILMRSGVVKDFRGNITGLRNPVFVLIDYNTAMKTSRGQTQRGIVGTTAYRAPEMAMGLPWNFPVDVFSLGAVVIECLDGELLIDFEVEDVNHVTVEDRLKHCKHFEKTMGKLPTEMLLQSAIPEIADFGRNYEPKRQDETTIQEKLKAPDNKDELFGHIVCSLLPMLTLNPAYRPTTKDLLGMTAVKKMKAIMDGDDKGNKADKEDTKKSGDEEDSGDKEAKDDDENGDGEDTMEDEEGADDVEENDKAKKMNGFPAKKNDAEEFDLLKDAFEQIKKEELQMMEIDSDAEDSGEDESIVDSGEKTELVEKMENGLLKTDTTELMKEKVKETVEVNGSATKVRHLSAQKRKKTSAPSGSVKEVPPKMMCLSPRSSSIF